MPEAPGSFCCLHCCPRSWGSNTFFWAAEIVFAKCCFIRCTLCTIAIGFYIFGNRTNIPWLKLKMSRSKVQEILLYPRMYGLILPSRCVRSPLELLLRSPCANTYHIRVRQHRRPSFFKTLLMCNPKRNATLKHFTAMRCQTCNSFNCS